MSRLYVCPTCGSKSWAPGSCATCLDFAERASTDEREALRAMAASTRWCDTRAVGLDHLADVFVVLAHRRWAYATADGRYALAPAGQKVLEVLAYNRRTA